MSWIVALLVHPVRSLDQTVGADRNTEFAVFAKLKIDLDKPRCQRLPL